MKRLKNRREETTEDRFIFNRIFKEIIDKRKAS